MITLHYTDFATLTPAYPPDATTGRGPMQDLQFTKSLTLEIDIVSHSPHPSHPQLVEQLLSTTLRFFRIPPAILTPVLFFWRTYDHLVELAFIAVGHNSSLPKNYLVTRRLNFSGLFSMYASISLLSALVSAYAVIVIVLVLQSNV